MSGVDIEALQRLDVWEWWRRRAAIIDALERGQRLEERLRELRDRIAEELDA